MAAEAEAAREARAKVSCRHPSTTKQIDFISLLIISRLRSFFTLLHNPTPARFKTNRKKQLNRYARFFPYSLHNEKRFQFIRSCLSRTVAEQRWNGQPPSPAHRDTRSLIENIERKKTVLSLNSFHLFLKSDATRAKHILSIEINPPLTVFLSAAIQSISIINPYVSVIILTLHKPQRDYHRQNRY